MLGVLVAGLLTITYFYNSFISKMLPYRKVPDLKSLLDNESFSNCFHKIKDGRRALLMDTLLLLVEQEEVQMVAIIKSCLKFFLQTDLEAFFILARLSHILHPEHYDNFASDEARVKTGKHLSSASQISSEVKNAADILIARAISNYFTTNSNIDEWTFVCRDMEQFRRMNDLCFGERLSTTISGPPEAVRDAVIDDI
jgi:hypothetical protein